MAAKQAARTKWRKLRMVVNVHAKKYLHASEGAFDVVVELRQQAPVFDQAFQTFLLRRLCHGLFWQPVMLTGADL